MKAYKACCLCGKEGHLSHACPLNKYRTIDDETARRIALAIHEADPREMFRQKPFHLTPLDREVVTAQFVQLMAPSQPQP